MPEVYVAAGSNVRPRASLRRALALLGEEFPGLASSPAYLNKATGFEGDDFINLVAAFRTERPLSEVVATLKSVERALGRERGGPKWGPRTLDLDLLLYGDTVRHDDETDLPHPDIRRYVFVLRPLADLAPDLRHPETGQTCAEIWRQFDAGKQEMRKADFDPRA